MHLGTTILICVVSTLFFTSTVKTECRWIQTDPNDTYNNRFCNDHPFEAICIGFVNYDLGLCKNGPNSDEYLYHYNIIINLAQPDENPFLQNVTVYIEVTMTDGYLVTIPKEVFNMTKLVNFKISGNKMRKINFNNFLPLPALKKIDLANNTIVILETEDESASSEYSSVRDINISFNFIENLPNNFVKRFRVLEHLDLSNNMITSIDKYAFEGTVQLKTLDLSDNRLQEVGNLVAQVPKLIHSDYETPKNLQKLSKLVLDSNFITYINFTEFFETGIPQLSIGLNRIPCHLLARMKYSKYSEKFSRIVTTTKVTYASMNIDGIDCQESQNEVKDTMIIPENLNDNATILITRLKNALENNGKSMDSLIEIVNQNEKKLENFIKNTNLTLASINDKLLEINSKLPSSPEVNTGALIEEK